MTEPYPIRRAAELVKEEWKVDSLPVRPIEIARDTGVTCEPMPASATGVSGMLLKAGDNFGILYATHIPVPGFHHFSVAHELGHLHLPEHPEKIFRNNLHQSNSGFASDDKYEKEADQFACGMLMPAFLFDPALDTAGEGLDAILALAMLCETSRTATAIRYAQRHSEPTAIVLSTNGIIDFCFMSDRLKYRSGITWPKKGESVPRGTATKSLTHDLVLKGHRVEKESDLSVWFKCSQGGSIYEEAIGLGAYGKVLTVLSCSEAPDEDEQEDEDDLEESWTPRFRKR